jgi:hypothetical protein
VKSSSAALDGVTQQLADARSRPAPKFDLLFDELDPALDGNYAQRNAVRPFGLRLSV